MLIKYAFLIIIINFLYFANIRCNEILGCGGFVKSNSVEIKFSKVELKLYSKQGSLKYQTDCAPNNGYYFIPLYDKGEYVLKVEPPEGWKFEPASVSLHVDGVTDACSQGQDINFQFMGFSVFGKVTSKGSSEGPSGITVTLKSQKGEKKTRQVETSAGGAYHFEEIFPGEYTLSVSHPVWKFERREQALQVTQDNQRVASDFIVSGYDVTGRVQSDGEPIRGVHFMLFSKDVNQAVVQGCDTSVKDGFRVESEHRYLCHVTSGSDGVFSFPSLSPGRYQLVPFYKGEHIEFDVSPNSLDFQVTHSSLTLKEQFLVQGFSVSGRVISSSGVGIAGVKIYLDGSHQGTTHENGVYHLENMKTGLYKMRVSADNYHFEDMAVKVTPNTPQLPDISPVKYNVCGTLGVSSSDSDFTLAKRSIQVSKRKVSANTNQESEMISTNQGGEFCVLLPPGEYTFKPIISREEIESGLQFSPNEITISLKDKPNLNLIFEQFSAVAEGRVTCLEDCSASDQLQLRLNPSRRNNDGFEIIPVEDNRFSISQLLPGSYQLTILKNDWCWKRSVLDFTVTNKDVQGLLLEHTGYQITFISSHATNVELTLPDKTTKVIKVGKGTVKECLPLPGQYSIKPSDCHLFQEDVFTFNTAHSTPVSLVATKHLVTGTIATSDNVTDTRLEISRDWNGIVEIENVTLKEGPSGKYSFSVWVHPQSLLYAKPYSSSLLFQPAFIELRAKDDCMLNALHFQGKMGLFIQGKVTPKLAGVTIKVYLQKTAADKEMELLKETVSDANGKYSIGPFNEETKFVVEAEKEGFTFTQIENKVGHFKAFKLAEILVEVTDENNSALSGVLLILSGGLDYKKNGMTQSEGRLQFLGLGPGEYFLRPVMKEYHFDPPNKMITIKEGETSRVAIKGKRVAYSAFGTVSSLTGEAEPGLLMEATGSGSAACKQFPEEALSEQDGKFRIRGLQPGCQYSIHLKANSEENQHVERLSPKEVLIKVNKGDVNDIRMVVFRRFNQMGISGYVKTNQEYLPTLKVRLFREDSPDQATHTLNLGQTSIFHFPLLPLDNRSYLLRLDSSLPSSQYHMDLPSVSFKANSTYRHFSLSFEPKPRSSEQEMAQGSLLVLPLILVISVLIFNYNKVLPVFGQLGEMAHSMLNSPPRLNMSQTSSNEAANSSSVSESSATGNRKKVKARRT